MVDDKARVGAEAARSEALAVAVAGRALRGRIAHEVAAAADGTDILLLGPAAVAAATGISIRVAGRLLTRLAKIALSAAIASWSGSEPPVGSTTRTARRG